MEYQFVIDVGGDPDHEDLVAEIYCGPKPEEDFVGMVTQDRGIDSLEIEIHPRNDGMPWKFRLEEFEAALKKARAKLIELRRSE